MAQISKRNQFIENKSDRQFVFGDNVNNQGQVNLIEKDLLLVPSLGNHAVYTIPDNTQTVDIDFILNTDLYEWIILATDDEEIDYAQSFEISQLSVQDGIVTVPFDPAYFYDLDQSFQVTAYLANKPDGSDQLIDYFQMTPSVFYIVNEEAPPVVFWGDDDPYPPAVGSNAHFVVFQQVPWLEPLYISSLDFMGEEIERYHCVSQGDSSEGMD